jgi:hypothetical protein
VALLLFSTLPMDVANLTLDRGDIYSDETLSFTSSISQCFLTDGGSSLSSSIETTILFRAPALCWSINLNDAGRSQ